MYSQGVGNVLGGVEQHQSGERGVLEGPEVRAVPPSCMELRSLKSLEASSAIQRRYRRESIMEKTASLQNAVCLFLVGGHCLRIDFLGPAGWSFLPQPNLLRSLPLLRGLAIAFTYPSSPPLPWPVAVLTLNAGKPPVPSAPAGKLQVLETTFRPRRPPPRPPQSTRRGMEPLENRWNDGGDEVSLHQIDPPSSINIYQAGC